jgi:hypothetical protein
LVVCGPAWAAGTKEGIRASEPLSVAQWMMQIPSADRWAPSERMWAQSFGEFDDDSDRDVVSVSRAVLYSAVLPGAGQWYVGSKRRASIFLATDALAWTMFGYFKTVEGIKERDHRRLAQVHAGVDPSGKDDEFYRTITFHASRDEFNVDRAPYQDALPTTDAWDWHWDSAESMNQYRTLRNQSNEANNRATFSLGAALVTRVAAALDAWRLARNVNRQARMELGWKLHVKPKPSLDDPSLIVLIGRKF